MILLENRSPSVSGFRTVDSHASVFAVNIIFIALTWSVVGLRLWTRVHIVKHPGWDDAAMVLALLFQTFYSAACMHISVLITGDMLYKELLEAINWLFVAEAMYIWAVIVVKISLGIFYLRILIVKWQRYTIYLALLVSTLFGIAFFLYSVFNCGTPTSAQVYFFRRAKEECAPHSVTLGMGYTHAAITAGTDIVFAVLPIIMVRESRMQKREKWTVSCILLLGAVGCICSIVRFKYIALLTSSDKEFFAAARDIGIWSAIEPGIAIICGSLATLRPLARSFLYHARSFASGSFGGYYSNSNGSERAVPLKSRRRSKRFTMCSARSEKRNSALPGQSTAAILSPASGAHKEVDKASDVGGASTTVGGTTLCPGDEERGTSMSTTTHLDEYENDSVGVGRDTGTQAEWQSPPQLTYMPTTKWGVVGETEDEGSKGPHPEEKPSAKEEAEGSEQNRHAGR